jgi:hypothetical protein
LSHAPSATLSRLSPRSALRLALSSEALAYGSLAVAYLTFRLGSFTGEARRLTNTVGYEHVAALHVWSLDFYAGERSFTLPLLYKVLARDDVRILAQLALSAACWLTLAAVAARAAHRTPVRLAVFVWVLGSGLTLEIVHWDALLMSESVSFSLLALLLACWFLFARRPGRGRAVAVLLVSLLWAFTRDANAYAVLMSGIAAAVALIWTRQRTLTATLAIGCALIFAGSTLSVDHGRRWFQPMIDVMAHRVLPDERLKSYFEAHGFDEHSPWGAEGGWAQRHARATYARYLLTHPAHLLTQPFRGEQQQALWSTPSNAASLIDPSLSVYVSDDDGRHRPLALPPHARSVFFPRGTVLVPALMLGLLAAAGAAALRRGATREWLVPLVALATVYPQLLLAWHLSGIEIDRHALTGAVLLRLLPPLVLLLAVDRALAARGEDQPGGPRFPSSASSSASR